MKGLLLVGLCFLLVSTFFAGCGETPAEPATSVKPETQVEPVPKPQLLAEWTSGADKTTEPFVVTESPWMISWAFYSKPGPYGISANLFSITAMRPTGEYVDLVVSFANAEYEMSDISYVYKTGTFYLEVESMSGTWAVQVWGN